MPFCNYRVSVIIPTLNEAKNLPLVLPRIPLDQVDEVILVDGRSTDDTVQVARSILPSIKVVLEPRRGKGAAMTAGYRSATGDIIIVIDADGSNDPREIPRFLRALVEGADFVKGSRFAHHGGTTDMPRYRQWGNGAFVHTVNTLFGCKFTDLCYGYHAFWRYCLDIIDTSEFDGFEIDTALYLRAVRERLRIVEVPSFEGYRFFGVGKLKTIPDGFRVLGTILREYTEHLSSDKHEDYLGFRSQQSPHLALSLPAASQRLALPEAGADGSALGAPLQTELQWMSTVSRALSLELHVRATLRRFLQLTGERLSALSGSVLMVSETGQVVDGCVMYEGELSPLQPHGRDELIQQGLAGWVVRTRQPILINDTTADQRWLCRTWEERERQSRSAMGVPLIDTDRIVGVLTLARPQPRVFTEADVALVSEMPVAA
jgi:putative methionine-R-sulfoxide reductase with GAF domain